jgi:hypothetical protein
MTHICGIGDDRSSPPARPCAKEFTTLARLLRHIADVHGDKKRGKDLDLWLALAAEAEALGL